MLDHIYLLCAFGFFVLVIWAIGLQWKRRSLYVAAAKMKGPSALPFIGNAMLFMCKNEKILMKIYTLIKMYTPGPIRFWLGPLLLIVVTEPKHLEKIMHSSKFSNKFSGIYRFPKIFLGEGLISGNGPHMKPDRKVILKMFDLNFVAGTMDVLHKHVELCLNNIEKKVDAGTFDIYPLIHFCLVDYIKEVVLGCSERTQLSGMLEFDELMSDGYELAFTRMAKPWQHIDFLFNLTPLGRKQEYIRKILRDKGQKMMEVAFKKGNLNNCSNDFHAVIDSMAQFSEEHPNFFTEERFVDHILTLYAAAEDTISGAAGFFAICMGMYPEYQERAAEEIREIFGDSPRPITAEDCTKSKFLTMCIKEILRLYPIGPILARECTEDFQLDEWIIPKGAAVVIPAFNIQRDPRFWEKPNSFYPEHFLPEAEAKRPYYAYVPFSVGSRGCVGKIMAKYVLKVIACYMLQRFKFEADGTSETLKIRMDISVRPINGWQVRVKKRVWK
ncbi:cytochrome P450 4C1-like [Euwallacea similis]|uniref:cytochrome P450 4C1-like n=1 Tax=Euwallacea similis TaxID=1736056 RepID=UPI00344B7A5E